jgi:hypothetical protein
MRGFALAVHAKASRIGHDDKAVVLKLAEPPTDAVALAAYFFLCVTVRQKDSAVVLLLEALPALEVDVQQARADGRCAPRWRPHHLLVEGDERREPALVSARTAHNARSPILLGADHSGLACAATRAWPCRLGRRGDPSARWGRH